MDNKRIRKIFMTYIIDYEEILGVKPIYYMHRYLMTKHNISL